MDAFTLGHTLFHMARSLSHLPCSFSESLSLGSSHDDLWCAFFVRWCHLFSFLQCKIFMPTRPVTFSTGFLEPVNFLDVCMCLNLNLNACMCCMSKVCRSTIYILLLLCPLFIVYRPHCRLSLPFRDLPISFPLLYSQFSIFRNWCLLTQLLWPRQLHSFGWACVWVRANDGGTASNIWI